MESRKAWSKRPIAVTLVFGLVAACGDEQNRTPSSASTEPAPMPSIWPESHTSSPSLKLLIETSIADLSIVQNGELSSGLPLRYEPFGAPRLAELRSRENLDAVVAGASDEFDVMLRLKDWVAAQWPHGTPDPYPPWDAITVLDWIRSGVTGGYCGQYAQVLLQSFASLGYRARYVEIGSNDNPYAHFVLEVWSNQFNKWVLLDADYNLHFERQGVPMSALEVHDALTHSVLSDVQVVLGQSRVGHPDPSRWPLLTAELYYYVRVHLKADHLTNQNDNPFDRYNDMIEWRDGLTVPWESSTVPSPYRKEALTNLATSDRSLVDSKLGQVRVTIESVDSNTVVLRFEHDDDDFLRYQIRERGRPGAPPPWRDHDGSYLDWQPTTFLTTLEVRAANTRGVVGPSSVVAARLQLDIRWVAATPP